MKPLFLAVIFAVATPVPAQTYTAVEGWAKFADGKPVGSTHGQIEVDQAGQIYVSSDGPRGLMIFDAEGNYLRSLDKKWGGVHGMVMHPEPDGEYLYLAHLRGKQVVKIDLEGNQIWSIGWPKESGLYDNKAQYKPTDVAIGPDGRIYVADGYGMSVIHIYDAGRNYLKTIGGKGKEPGQFITCHGVEIDNRYFPPRLLVSDRENNRLQHFTLDGDFMGIVATGLERPCSVSIHEGLVAVAELNGRVTVLNKDNEVHAHLGQNPDPKLRGVNGVLPELWKTGVFTAPHGVGFDAMGNLFVQDWNKTGRITKLAVSN
ncbi:hypothetical protein OAF27_01560 [Verrucomicrobiales bacterium]|nr:hypothetical protein [Verrucomicrobiales bacterium]